MQLKKIGWVRNVYFMFFKGGISFFRFSPILFLKQFVWFFNSLRILKTSKVNNKFETIQWYPCLNDNTSYTPLEPTYFFQDTWAAKHIYKLKPDHHYDVGSSVMTMGVLSQFVPVTLVDIRPIELKLDNLFFKKGSILDLPFEDNSLSTLSSLCVVEHIGLGRYGDPIDSFGSEKAIKELKRVLKVGGVLLFSVPVDDANKIYFNAHRAFTRSYILELFNGFSLLDEKYHYQTSMINEYDKNKGFGTGLYMLRKEK